MDNNKDLFTTKPYVKKVDKPWGYELIYTPDTLPYTGKILMVKAGKKLSFQYHDEKVETLTLFSGQALLWLENVNGEIEKVAMEPQQGYTVSIYQKHRVEALADSIVLEASLPETGTTVRVEDDFNRPDETEQMRIDPNRGWQS